MAGIYRILALRGKIGGEIKLEEKLGRGGGETI